MTAMRVTLRSRGAALGVAVLLSAGCHTGFRSSPVVLTTPAADQMRSDVTYLASEALEGRGTGTPGNDSAAGFIARRYDALRLASIAQADRPPCAKGGVTDIAECFVLPFTASVPVRNAAPRLLKTQNVAAIIPGGGPLAGEYVIVGAHFGSVPDMGAADVKGMKRSGVRPGSPAEKGGLKAGDIIVVFGGKTINNIYDYTDALGSHKPGDVVEVIVQRAGGQVTLQITLGTRG